jgi:hypothetical protein
MTSTAESTTTAQVGQPVQYIGHGGQPFAATILLTPDTWDQSKARYDQRAPEPGEVTLEITRPSGHKYVRSYIPLEGSEAHAKLVAAAEAATAPADTLGGLADDEDEHGEIQPQVTVRYWRPIP